MMMSKRVSAPLVFSHCLSVRQSQLLWLTSGEVDRSAFSTYFSVDIDFMDDSFDTPGLLHNANNDHDNDVEQQELDDDDYDDDEFFNDCDRYFCNRNFTPTQTPTLTPSPSSPHL